MGGEAHVRILHLHGRVERLIANLFAGLARARQIVRLRLLLVAQRGAHALAHRMRVLRRLLRLVDLLSVCGAVVRPAPPWKPSVPPSDRPPHTAASIAQHQPQHALRAASATDGGGETLEAGCSHSPECSGSTAALRQSAPSRRQPSRSLGLGSGRRHVLRIGHHLAVALRLPLPALQVRRIVILGLRCVVKLVVLGLFAIEGVVSRHPLHPCRHTPASASVPSSRAPGTWDGFDIAVAQPGYPASRNAPDSARYINQTRLQSLCYGWAVHQCTQAAHKPRWGLEGRSGCGWSRAGHGERAHRNLFVTRRPPHMHHGALGGQPDGHPAGHEPRVPCTPKPQPSSPPQVNVSTTNCSSPGPGALDGTGPVWLMSSRIPHVRTAGTPHGLPPSPTLAPSSARVSTTRGRSC